MQFQVEAAARYGITQRSTAILNVAALRTPTQTVLDERLSMEPNISWEELTCPPGENRFVRLDTGDAKQLTVRYSAKVATSPKSVRWEDIDGVTVAQADRAVIPYLFPSRYCQSDRLRRLAWGTFGSIGHPFQQVIAITDWIYHNVEYLPGTTSSETSAFDTITQRAGVCRDFAHLGIALCRALSIPARYLSGYAYQLRPPDFHACFEAFVGDGWFVFDATRMAPLNGLIRVAIGRDAADAAIATTFGEMIGTELEVSCEALEGHFVPWTQAENPGMGMSLGG